MKKSVVILENLIRRLENNLGRNHLQSPFSSLQQPQENVQAKPVEIQKQAQEQKPVQEQKSNGQTQQIDQSQLSDQQIQEFKRLDIRVGRIIEAWKHPESENLYCEKIDMGDEVREIASGLQKFVDIKDMSGLVLVLTNLGSRKIAGFPSNGMVLCASTQDKDKVELLRPDSNTPLGTRVSLQGNDFGQTKEDKINPKKKELEKVLPFINTNSENQAQFHSNKNIQLNNIIHKLIIVVIFYKFKNINFSNN